VIGTAAKRTARASSELALRTLDSVTLAAVDAALGSRTAERVVDRLFASPLMERAVNRALGGPLVEAVGREVVHSAVIERLADTALDDEALEALLASPAVERIVARTIQSRVMDEVVTRLLESEDLWILVDEIARSPAVSEAITQQSLGFADQMFEPVRVNSRNADTWLATAARRALRRGRDGGVPDEPATGASTP
jgi:hypothetical protein